MQWAQTLKLAKALAGTIADDTHTAREPADPNKERPMTDDVVSGAPPQPAPPPAPTPAPTPAAGPTSPPTGDAVDAKLQNAAALAGVLAQNPEVLKFMNALLGGGGTSSG